MNRVQPALMTLMTRYPHTTINLATLASSSILGILVDLRSRVNTDDGTSQGHGACTLAFSTCSFATMNYATKDHMEPTHGG